MDIKTMVIKGQKGDLEALGQMYVTFAPQMRMTCAKLLKKQAPVIEDLVHDSFILAYTSLSKLKNPEKLGTWLNTIIRNVTIRYIETQKVKKTEELCTTKKDSLCFPASPQSSDSQTLTNEILDIINELPYGYQKILHLHIFEGYSHQEIGEIMGIAAHSSSSQLSRAKSALQRIMKERKLWYIILSSVIIVPIYKLFFEKKIVVNNSIVTHDKLQSISKRQQDTEIKSININNTKRKNGIVVAQAPKALDAYTTNIQDSTCDICYDSTITKEETDKNIINDDAIQNMHNTTSIKTDSNLNNDIQGYRKNEHKWEIACSGLLGSSMNKDGIGTMVSTAGNNVLQEFNNWEAYTEDLLINNPTPNNKVKTLMNIATNNSGDIVEHEKHLSPITIGIALSKQVTNCWHIETGLQYTLLRSTLSIGNKGYSIDREQKLYYLGFPIQVDYKLLDYKKMSAYTNAGITINLPIYGKVEETYVENYEHIPSENWRISAPWQFTLNTSICLQYKITYKLGFYIEPTLNYNVPNGSNTHSVWTEHPFLFTMPFGVRYTW